jgi:hypothetical protein
MVSGNCQCQTLVGIGGCAGCVCVGKRSPARPPAFHATPIHLGMADPQSVHQQADPYCLGPTPHATVSTIGMLQLQLQLQLQRYRTTYHISNTLSNRLGCLTRSGQVLIGDTCDWHTTGREIDPIKQKRRITSGIQIATNSQAECRRRQPRHNHQIHLQLQPFANERLLPIGSSCLQSPHLAREMQKPSISIDISDIATTLSLALQLVCGIRDRRSLDPTWQREPIESVVPQN